MVKKITTFSLMIIGMVGIIGFLAWVGGKGGKADQQINNTETALKGGESFFDFGTVSMAKGKVSHVFRLENSSDKPIDIRSVSTSCMCTIANLTLDSEKFGPFGMEGMSNNSFSKVIQPGQLIEVEAVFDPSAHGPAGVGTISREVTLKTTTGSRSFQFRANVIP